jgi:hypothetical protein
MAGKPKETIQQRKMSNPELIKQIHIIGAGGVGWYVAVILSRESMGREIHIWDNDTFEGGHGFRRLPTVSKASTPKVDLLEGHITIVWNEKPPIKHNELFTGKGKKDWLKDAFVLDCTDMGNNPRRKMWEEAEKHGALMARISYDGNGVVLGDWGLPFGDTERGGYEAMPSLAQSFTAGGVGGQFVHKLLKGEPVDRIVVRI